MKHEPSAILFLEVDLHLYHLQQYMDKKHKTIKESLKKTSQIPQDKAKKLRTVTGRSPKAQDYPAEKKFLEPEKNKISHLGSQRAINKSIVPLQSPLASGERQLNKLKLFHSNISCTELPLSLSEKTIKFVKSVEKKPGNKLTKTKKKTKMTKAQKEEEERRAEEKCGITRRKVAETKDDYEVLYRKTEQILKEYQSREQEWEREKTILMEQLEDFRRKSMGMALTNCSTYSINRRNFF